MNNPIYKIAANQSFFNELAAGIISKFSSICKLNDVIILLPTKYACNSLEQVFQGLNQGIPNIQPIGDLSDLLKIDQIPLDRLSLVNKISLILLELNFPHFNNLYAITELAEYFADFLHKIELYQINLDKILQIINEDLSLHKQLSSDLFKQFILKWEENYSLTKAGYNNFLIEKLIKEHSNKKLVIAGVHSGIPSIIRLFNKADYIILYAPDERDFSELDECHPQYNVKNLLNNKKIENWHTESINNEFIYQALRPSKLCNNWYKLNELDSSNIKFLSCQDQYQEAKAILDIIIKEKDKSINIVTADDDLMVKIILHLEAMDIKANIIRDYPLIQDSSAVFLLLILNAMLDNFSLVSALAILKHQFSPINANEVEGLIRDRSFFSKNIFDLKLENFDKFIDYKKSGSFKELLADHLKYAQELANQDIWQTDSAKELDAFLKQLHDSYHVDIVISLEEYAQLLNHFLKSAYYRKKPKKSRVTLLKPIDARLHNADLTILAGMNEGIWPTKAAIDPCFNQSLLRKIGLPSEAQQIGEEAYDFQCFASGAEVLITRSEKIEASIKMTSRWVSRLLTLSRNSIQLDPNLSLDNYIQNIKPNPSPMPKLEQRPTLLSVTQIEKLIFNPYHIYVDLILKLKKLPALNQELSALLFGNFIHKALEIYYKNKRDSITKAGKQALNELELNHPSIKMLWWPRFLRIATWFINNEEKDAKIYLESYGSMKIRDDFTIIARADRIELLANNSINIIDYKTGNLSSARSIYTGKTLQLLLQAIIAENTGFKWQSQALQINSLQYIQLSGGEEPANILEIDIVEKPIIAQTKQYLLDLLEQYQDELTAYHYSKKKTMGYCEYAHLARDI